MTPSLTITDAAQEYIAELLAKQGGEVNIRVFVADPGTPKAESCVAYCRPGEEEADDLPLELKGFKAFIEARSLPFLEEALIDYAKDRFGGQLTIKAPHAKIGRIDASSPLEDRINHVLYVEVNPNLAAHGGEVSLVEVVDGSIAVLKFGGGCQGCSAADLTLKEGIHRAFRTAVPFVTTGTRLPFAV